jgi:hypothetical protein
VALHDTDAVVAAMTLPYSQGQTEGRINKLKLVKRSMYGRGKFDLLRQRVLVRIGSLRALKLLLGASLNSVHQILGRTVKAGQTQTQESHKNAVSVTTRIVI